MQCDKKNEMKKTGDFGHYANLNKFFLDPLTFECLFAFHWLIIKSVPIRVCVCSAFCLCFFANSCTRTNWVYQSNANLINYNDASRFTLQPIRFRVNSIENTLTLLSAARSHRKFLHSNNTNFVCCYDFEC